MERFAINDEQTAIKAIDQHNRYVRRLGYKTMEFDRLISIGQKKYGVLGMIVLCNHVSYPCREYSVYSGGFNWQCLGQVYLHDDQETHSHLQNGFGLWDRSSRMVFIREWNKHIKTYCRIKNPVEAFVV